MLNSVDFIYIATTFVIFILIGILLRIVYNSKTWRYGHTRIKNVLLLTFTFPIIAYNQLSKHKTDYIAKVNKDKNLTEEQKIRLRKRLSSNKRIALFVFINSIIKFKRNLDAHIKFLNLYKEEHGTELNFTVRIRVEFKKINDDNDFYDDNIKGLVT